MVISSLPKEMKYCQSRLEFIQTQYLQIESLPNLFEHPEIAEGLIAIEGKIKELLTQYKQFKEHNEYDGGLALLTEDLLATLAE
jgi:hypothetical protein